MRATAVSGVVALAAWILGRYTGARAGYRLGHDRVCAWMLEHSAMPQDWAPEKTRNLR